METKPVRARTKKGQYQGDNPATPDVNEAWVAPVVPPDAPPLGSAAYKAMVLRGEVPPAEGAL